MMLTTPARNFHCNHPRARLQTCRLCAMATSSPDIDRGWAFVVMLGVGLNFLLTIGISHSTAIFYTTFLEEFDQSPTLTAWAVNLNTFCTYLFGQLSHILLQKLDHRTIMAFGCLLSTAGLLASSYAPSVQWELVTFGLVTGTGFALAFVPTFDMIAIYFRRYRRLAFSLTSAGGAIGQFIYPALFQTLSEYYHWRGAFLLAAGFNLHLLVIAAMMMPPRVDASEVDEEAQLTALVSLDDKEEDEAPKKKSLLSRPIILDNPRLASLVIGTLFSGVGVSAFYTHVSNYGLVSGHGVMASTFLASAVGLGGLAGRVAIAFIIFHPAVHTPTLVTFCLSIAGIVSGLFGLVSSYPVLIAMCVMFGLLVGAWGVLPEVTIVAAGVENVSASMASVCMASALGFVAGGPVAAWVYEVDPSYVWSFVIVGLISLVGGLMLLPACVEISGGRVRLARIRE